MTTTLQNALVWELKNNAAITVHVGGRVYPMHPPRKPKKGEPKYPLIVITLGEGESFSTFDGPTGLSNYLFDIEVQADKYTSMEIAAKKVRLFLHGKGQDATFGSPNVEVHSIRLISQSDSTDGPDDGSDEPLFIRSMAFDFWWQEPTT